MLRLLQYSKAKVAVTVSIRERYQLLSGSDVRGEQCQFRGRRALITCQANEQVFHLREAWQFPSSRMRERATPGKDVWSST